MNNSNYGYPPSGYTSPYSSTPSNIRPYRPRFGFSGPSLYPRPRSSASKTNPDSFSDSMSNNFGNSTSRIDNFNSDAGTDSYNNSYKNDSSSSYYSANDNYYPEQPSDNTSMPSAARSDMGYMRESSLLYGNKPPTHADTFAQPRFPYSSLSLGVNSNGGFQKPYSSTFSLGNRQSFASRKFGKAKRRGMASKQGAWKCQLCNLDFTSQIPYDMHLRGARHAKKVKAHQASTDGVSQAVIGEGGEKALFCALCNVKANSLLQYHTHLEGTKHKNKLNPKDPNEPATDDQTKKKKKEKKASADSTNGKTNGSLTRSLPSDFGEPQPAKLMKFSCDICSLSVNSDVQLQQHLSSKKHQNKVEGKTVVKVRKNKSENKDPSGENMETSESAGLGETGQKIVGVKTLASSFVQGGTLQ